DSFRESLDRKIFWVMATISVLIAAAMFCISFEPGKIVVLFGTWEFASDTFTIGGSIRPDRIATLAVSWIMELTLGWPGIILAIIATAGFFPGFIEHGSIDLVLSKPMARWCIFLGKYFGSMVFVLVQALIFVTLTFVVLGLRWGAWLPGYLWTIPLVVLLFSYIYCVSVWVAVHFRSTVAAIVISLGAWMMFFGVQTTADLFDMYPAWQRNQTVHTAFRAARWMIPKTQDITYLAANWCGASPSGEVLPDPDPDETDTETIERATAIERDRMNVNPVHTIGSSLLFEALVVLLAMWKFSRSDY
ncbi:MAG: ABC transporter permease subunit, partial [Planctomycetes bacterium]|nr:ABC transporter permease subunit [Planctomycetota bacterium]